MANRALLSVSLISATFVLVGCATVFSGTRENVVINSNPSGALILVDGLEMGTTPATVPLSRPGLGGGKTVTLRLDGYADRSFALQSTFNAVSLVNLLFWPGFIVDALTGAITRYDPSAYSVTMEQERVGMATHLGVDHVVFLNELASDITGQYIVPDGGDGLRIAIIDPITKQAVILK
jgi:hypothetical protein